MPHNQEVQHYGRCKKDKRHRDGPRAPGARGRKGIEKLQDSLRSLRPFRRIRGQQHGEQGVEIRRNTAPVSGQLGRLSLLQRAIQECPHHTPQRVQIVAL